MSAHIFFSIFEKIKSLPKNIYMNSHIWLVATMIDNNPKGLSGPQGSSELLVGQVLCQMLQRKTERWG